ncbi:tyrosine-protein phosphatase [Desulfovibrio sp. OttesenSCG-928-G15]|nr:tyrosine-protein phosphatase [Desulfovibrio sp. OttesenSCG-928-G15]
MLFFCMLCAVCFVCCIPKTGLCAGTEQARIERDRHTKVATLHITDDAPWALYRCAGSDLVGATADAVKGEEVLRGEKAGRWEVPYANNVRQYFILEQGGTSTRLAAVRLPLSGGYNFRDMGGIRTADGKTVRWGKLVRSDSLAHLTDDDIAYLGSIPLHTIVDFRTVSEAAKAPDRNLASVKHVLHYPVLPGSLDPNVDPEEEYSRALGDEFMEHLNRSMVTDEHIVAVYKEFFTQIQKEENLPLLFHCSAGKDRTGYAAALILFSLGVDKEIVLRDYMDSARYLEGKYDDLITRNPERKALFTVKQSYLEAAITAMEKKSGSVQRYLSEELGVDAKKMRALFLEPER